MRPFDDVIEAVLTLALRKAEIREAHHSAERTLSNVGLSGYSCVTGIPPCRALRRTENLPGLKWTPMMLNGREVSSVMLSERAPTTPLAGPPSASAVKTTAIVPVGSTRSPECGALQARYIQKKSTKLDKRGPGLWRENGPGSITRVYTRRPDGDGFRFLQATAS